MTDYKKLLQYRFDNYIARGTGSLLVVLLIATLVVVISVAVLMLIFDMKPATDAGVAETFWVAFMHTYETGLIAFDEGPLRGRWEYRGIVLIACVAGLFIFSSFIGVLTNGLAARIQELRRGRSPVMEQDHDLILGWSDSTLAIVRELAAAAEDKKRQTVVIMANEDKEMMEDQIRVHVSLPKNVEVYCRSGNTSDPVDLTRVRPERAKSIMVLPVGAPDDVDAHVLKTVLALQSVLQKSGASVPVITSLVSERASAVMKVSGWTNIWLVPVDSIVSRVIAQTCRQPGLVDVYTNLLSFEGDEAYLIEVAELVGRTYGESLLAFGNASPMGIRQADGSCEINPPIDQTIAAGDQLIIVATTRTAAALKDSEHLVEKGKAVVEARFPPSVEKTLVLGYNRRAAAVIKELDYHASRNTPVTVCIHPEQQEELVALSSKLRNLKMSIVENDFTSRKVLETLDCAAYSHIVILSDARVVSAIQEDTDALIALLHVQEILGRADNAVPLVAELIDDKNAQLVPPGVATDYVVSSKLSSLYSCQIAQNPVLDLVYEQLFNPDGADIFLRPVEHYVKVGEELNYATLVDAVRRRHETALGYRIDGVLSLNPPKSARVAFKDGDHVVLLSHF